MRERQHLTAFSMRVRCHLGDYNISLRKPFACTYLNVGDEGSTATQGALRDWNHGEGSLFRRGFYLTRRSMGLLARGSIRILAQRKSRGLLSQCVMGVWSSRPLGWCYRIFKFFAMIWKIAYISLSVGDIQKWTKFCDIRKEKCSHWDLSNSMIKFRNFCKNLQN